jgi:hypothetical protein
MLLARGRVRRRGVLLHLMARLRGIGSCGIGLLLHLLVVVFVLGRGISGLSGLVLWP